MIVANDTVRVWKEGIPEHWQVMPLKHAITYNEDKLSDQSDDEYEFDYVDIGSVTYGKGIETYQHMKFGDAPSRARRIVQPKDVIMSTVRTYLKATAKIEEHDNPVIVSTGFMVMRARDGVVLPDFLGYVAQSDGLVSEIECQSYGTSYPAINAGEIANLSIPIPPLPEQQAIVRYLDSKCSAIDEAIERHKKIIEKLEEYKTSFVTKVLTKGLDNAKSYPSSGIQQIGDIPAHWMVLRIKHLLSNDIVNLRVGPFGSALSTKEYTEDGPWVYTQRTVLDNNFENNNVHISEEKYSSLEGFAVHEGDLLVTTRGSIGKLAIAPKNTPKGILHPCLIKFRVDQNRIHHRILEYLFNHTDLVMNQIRKKAEGATIEALYSGPLKDVYVPLPPYLEQIEMLDVLDGFLNKIQSGINAHNSIISKLEEYRKSLIYNAVTGKIDCRTEAAG